MTGHRSTGEEQAVDVRRTIPEGNRALSSGHVLKLEGEFRFAIPPKAGPMPVIATKDKTAHVLDPPAIVTGQDGSVIYDPYQISLDDHLPDIRKWLQGNPKWKEQLDSTWQR